MQDCELTDNQYKHIRDKAAASLAKEERDFTSTVVISNDKTVILPNSDQYKSGKRNKKMPKRYDDCINQLIGIKNTSDVSDSECISNKKVVEIAETKEETIDELRNSLPAKEFLNRLVHVSVNLERMDNLLELEPWCMVHCLYKCFCKLNATRGKPFDFTVDFVERYKDEKDTKVKQKESAKDIPRSNSKDVQKEQKVTSKLQYREDSDTSPSHSRKRNSIYEDDRSWLPHCKIAKPMSALYEMNCARTLPVIAKSIQQRNTERLRSNRKEIEQHESDNPRLLVTLIRKIKACLMTIADETPLPPNAEPILIQDSPKKSEIKQSATNEMKENQNKIPDEPLPSTSGLMKKDLVKSKPEPPLDPLTLKQSQKNIKILNYIVSKSMQSICEVQRKSTKKLGPPLNKVLTFVQWSDICEAFNENEIYVWNIQLDSNENILAVTTQNIMPVVRRAVCVINIKAVSSERLPVVGQMLKLGAITEKTRHLAVLLSGVSNFWRIIGCIHSNHEYLRSGVQVKPTPITHPKASAKISALYQILTKRQQARQQESQAPPIIKSNIPLLELSNQMLISISAPIPTVESHRWFMVQIGTDFSHIHIPDWNSFLSLEKILQALKYAKETRKTVKISQPGNKIEVYAPNNERNEIIVGPYVPGDTFDLRLFMYYNRKMILLENYHKLNPLAEKMDKRTNGCWLYMKNNVLQICKPLDKQKAKVVENDCAKQNRDVDDDDCFITKAMDELRKISTPAADQIDNKANTEIVEKSQENQVKLIIDSDDDCVIVETPASDVRHQEPISDTANKSSERVSSSDKKHDRSIDKSTVRNKRMPRMKFVHRVDLRSRIENTVRDSLTDQNHMIQESPQSESTNKIVIGSAQTITNSSFEKYGSLNSSGSMLNTSAQTISKATTSTVQLVKVPIISSAQTITNSSFEKCGLPNLKDSILSAAQASLENIKATSSTTQLNKVPFICSAQTINKDTFEKLSATNPNIPKQVTVESAVSAPSSFEKLTLTNINIPKQITVAEISEIKRSYSPIEPPPFVIMKPEILPTESKSYCIPSSTSAPISTTSSYSATLPHLTKLTNSASLASSSVLKSTEMLAKRATKLVNSAKSTNSAASVNLAPVSNSATFVNLASLASSTSLANSATKLTTKPIVPMKNQSKIIQITESNTSNKGNIPPLAPIQKMTFTQTPDKLNSEPSLSAYVPKLPPNTKLRLVSAVQPTAKTATVTVRI